MIEEILPNLYRIEIPLPRSPLKYLNSYLVKGGGRFLLIDTGMNREECKREMISSLAEPEVDFKKTDLFITHLHADHLGLAASLATDTSTVYFNEKEASIINAEIAVKNKAWRKRDENFLRYGFPEEELEKAAGSHPGRRFGLKQHLDFTILKEGDAIEIGDYSFRCVETPGHSPGHLCLYEADKKILIAGDHILFDITPNITFWLEMENSLKQYLASLEKVYALDINLILPGHRRLLNGHRQRIRELQEHHQARLNEILSALEEGEKTAFQAATYITWNIDFSSWEMFPAAQKWFAFGETLAHLKYLEEKQVVQERSKGNKVVFSLK
ncbi:MBL fold metallo-hydrolase [Chloroflexota bacterium]